MQHFAQFLPRQQPANNMHVIGHDTPGHEPIPLSLPEMQSVGHQFAKAWIAQETCTQAAIKILFQFCSAEFGDQHLLGRQQMSAHALCRNQNAVTLRYLLQDRQRQGVRQMKGKKIQACVLLPMGQASALPNAHFTEPRLYRPLNDGSCGRLGKGDRLDHNCEFYAEWMGAGETPTRQPVWGPALPCCPNTPGARTMHVCAHDKTGQS